MNYRRLQVVADAGDPVLSVDQFKLGARLLTGSVEDTFIAAIIKTAQLMVENHTGQCLTRKTLKLLASWWPGCSGLVLMYPPATLVDSVKYLADDDGLEHTLDPSVYDADLEGNMRPTISLAWTQTWPVLRRHPAPVRVQYQAGYASGQCPQPLVDAVRMIAQDLYENREAQIVSQYFGERSAIPNPMMTRLLSPYTLWEM